MVLYLQNTRPRSWLTSWIWRPRCSNKPCLYTNSDCLSDPVQYLIRSVEAYGFTFLDYIKVQTLLRLSWLLPGRCKAKRRQEHQPPQKCQGLWKSICLPFRVSSVWTTKLMFCRIRIVKSCQIYCGFGSNGWLTSSVMSEVVTFEWLLENHLER